MNKDAISDGIAQVAGVLIIIALQYLIVQLGVPWYVVAAVTLGLLLAAVVILASSLTIPVAPRYTTISENDESIPWKVRHQLDGPLYRLRDTGLQRVGSWLRSTQDTAVANSETFSVVLQDPKSTEIVVLEADDSGQSAICMRRRSDGSWLETGTGSFQGEPSHPADDTLYVAGMTDPLKIWRAHQTRVARDRSVLRNDPIKDPAEFLANLVRRDSQQRLGAGTMSEAGTGRMRVGMRGAISEAAFWSARVLSPRAFLRRRNQRRMVDQLAAGTV